MIINGGPGADTLTGTLAADEVNGFAANDVIDGRGGNDVLRGGTGDDRIVGYLGDTVFGGSGEDTVRYTFAGGTGIEFDMIEVGANLDGVDQVLINFSSGNDTLRVGSPQFMFEEGIGGAGFDLFEVDFSARDAASPIRFVGVQTTFGVVEITPSGPSVQTIYDGFEDLEITGGAGNDFFNFQDWQGGDDLILEGGGGDDTLVLSGLGGALFGGDGNDELTANGTTTAADTLRGGAGDDMIFNIRPEDEATGGSGNDVAIVDLRSATAGVVIGAEAAFADFEEIYGWLTGFDDALHIDWQSQPGLLEGGTVFGGAGNDSLTLDFSRITGLGFTEMTLAGFGLSSELAVGLFAPVGFTELQFEEFETVTVLGSAGNDRLSGTEAFTRIDGQDGDDWIIGAIGEDLIYGGDGNDSIIGDAFGGVVAPVDRLFGGRGDDTIRGEAGNDRIKGGADNDSLAGDDGDDRLSGGSGSDTLEGGFDGEDRLSGGSGNDVLRGEENDDDLNGGSGNDTVDGGSGTDRIIGGTGDDSLEGDGMSAFDGGDDQIFGGSGNDTVSGDDGNDLLYGGDGNDVLTGGSGPSFADDDDRLFGEEGDDVLIGGEGKDNLSGDAGNDTLRGGDGADRLDGGLGTDRFVFDRGFSFEPERDTIIGYEEGEILSFTDSFLTLANITQIAGSKGLLLRWTDGEILIAGYSGPATVVFGEDAPLI